MRLLWAIFAGIMSGVACWADYLPVIGPTPLRFETKVASVQVVSNLATLPGAEMTIKNPVVDAPPVVTQPQVTQPEPWTVDWFSPEPFGPQVNQPIMVETAPAITNYVRSGVAALDPPEPSLEIVTPQMMVHYFQPSGTNSPLASIPIVFIPPQPPRSSSKATFKIAEPEGKR